MTAASDLSFVPVRAEELRADPARALSLARLAMRAQPLFYEAAGIDTDVLADAVTRQIAQPGLDMASAFVLRDGDVDIALIAGVPLSSLPPAQAASMAALLKLAPANARKQAAAAIKVYAAGIEPIADSGLYVSRVAVLPNQAGRGLGRQMLGAYLAAHGSAAVHLHVHRENVAAIALYRAFGFRARSSADYVFPAFTRPAS